MWLLKRRLIYIWLWALDYFFVTGINIAGFFFLPKMAEAEMLIVGIEFRPQNTEKYSLSRGQSHSHCWEKSYCVPDSKRADQREYKKKEGSWREPSTGALFRSENSCLWLAGEQEAGRPMLCWALLYLLTQIAGLSWTRSALSVASLISWTANQYPNCHCLRPATGAREATHCYGLHHLSCQTVKVPESGTPPTSWLATKEIPKESGERVSDL